MITAAHLGSEGSYSHTILSAHFQALNIPLELIGFHTNREVARAVSKGEARFGILPIDNVVAGTFRDGYDLIAQYSLHPVREILWRMDHHVLGVEGATLPRLRRLEGHPSTIDACGQFLATLGHVTITPIIDIGSAASDIARAGDASRAILGPPALAKRSGLVELTAPVTDVRENITRFLLVEGGPRDQWTSPSSAHRRTSILLRVPHTVGSLAGCLMLLSGAGINVSKIESRPHTQRPWEYAFYVDIDADAEEPSVAAALARLRAACSDFRVLGSYDCAAPLGAMPPPFGTEWTTNPSRRAMTSPPDSAPVSVRSKPSSAIPPPTAKNWPKAARANRAGDTIVRVGDVQVGGDRFIVIAGPCSVESRDQVMETASFVGKHGAVMLRGGAFKPRTHPYAFQGLGWEGVELLVETRKTTGLPIVSEVMSVDQVDRMAESVDVLQIGARNMQNFDLLKAVGKTKRPVLLKRGMSATLDELLAAAEYVLAEGNENVILCERGIRTFETATRNTLDLSAVPVLRERSHLPIMVDPSHGVGVRRWIPALARAAKAVGAHGIIVEVHPNPAVAKSDADQALRFEQFETMMKDLLSIPDYESLGS